MQPINSDYSLEMAVFKGSVQEYATYINDTYKISSRVALNLGLRYEAFIMPQPTQPNPALPQSARINSDTQMWQPRLGITWDFRGDGKTRFEARWRLVLRAHSPATH